MLVTLRNIIHTLWQLPQKGIIALIDLYQATLSPDHGLLKNSHPYGFCRLHPTCSAFARHAILEKGALYGSLLSLQRILSCTPWKAPSEERIMEICYDSPLCLPSNQRKRTSSMAYPSSINGM